MAGTPSIDDLNYLLVLVAANIRFTVSPIGIASIVRDIGSVSPGAAVKWIYGDPTLRVPDRRISDLVPRYSLV